MSASTTVLLVRHAACEGLGVRLSCRPPGPALTDVGREQAGRLAARLDGVPLAGLFSSPLARAFATATIVATRRRCAVHVRPDLREVAFGAWEGARLAELAGDPMWRAYNAHRAHTRIPGGETADEVQARVLAAVHAMARAYAGGTVVAVTHAEPIRYVVCACLGWSLDLASSVPIEPSSITRVVCRGGTLGLLGLNDVAHLEHAPDEAALGNIACSARGEDTSAAARGRDRHPVSRTMAKQDNRRSNEAEARAARGQSLAQGDTGRGDTGVAPDRQGISNRPGDRDDIDTGATTDRDADRRRRPGQDADRAEDDEDRHARDLGAIEAGAPPRQDQIRPTTGLGASQSGRARDEGPDRIERTGEQHPRREAEALAPSDIDPAERETM